MQIFVETAMKEMWGYWSFHWDSLCLWDVESPRGPHCVRRAAELHQPTTTLLRNLKKIGAGSSRVKKYTTLEMCLIVRQCRAAGVEKYPSLSLNKWNCPCECLEDGLRKRECWFWSQWWCLDHNNSAESLGPRSAARANIGAGVAAGVNIFPNCINMWLFLSFLQWNLNKGMDETDILGVGCQRQGAKSLSS